MCKRKATKRYIYESDTSFPTIDLESLINFFWIESYENRDFFDVLGAYLNGHLPEKNKLVKFIGHFVDIMCEVNPELNDDIIHE